MGNKDDEETKFLNVDLDIYARSDLQPLVNALGKKVYELHVGRVRRTYYAHLELDGRGPASPDAAIRRFAALIRALPKAERKRWNDAKMRDFNIGVQSGLEPFSQVFTLEATTVAAAAELNARILFTVYAPELRQPPRKRAGPGQRREGSNQSRDSTCCASG